MVFTDEVFYIHGPPTHLLSVHVANQRLLADRIFLSDMRFVVKYFPKYNFPRE
jgi:hypothetical protein